MYLANEKGVDEETALELYSLGLACAIISPSSKQKSSILTIILKDDRSKLSMYSDLLQRFATGMLIKPAQAEKFFGSL